METLADQVAYYNRRWTSFQYANLYGLERCLFILNAINDLKLERPRICDFGCGAGWLTGILSTFGPTIGVDLSPKAVELARENYPTAQFACVDGTRWDFEPNVFDVVVSQEVIEHVEDKRAYLGVIRKALNVGGYLFLTTPNLDVLNAIPPEERQSVWEIQPVELPLSRTQLNEMLKQARFEVLQAGSVVTGCGKLGWQRLLNSYKLNKLFEVMGLGGAWQKLLCHAGYGMYLTTVARKLP